MARGKSGRIVIEVDPTIKRSLYLSLEQNQITLKDWFLEAASFYITNNLPPTTSVQNSITTNINIRDLD